MKPSRRAVRIRKQILRVAPRLSVELLFKNRCLLGLGVIKIGDIALRSGAVPLRPDFSTPDAVHYQDFILRKIIRKKEEVILCTEAIGRPEVYGEIMDEYSYNLAFPRLRDARCDRLDWILSPKKLDLDGQSFIGFSLGFRFQSARSEIHHFTTVATWEIGGRITGNTIYHQAYTCPPVSAAAKSDHFSTTCLKQLDLWNHWLGNSYQMLPRWGCIQPFDFQTAREGVLFGYWPDKHSVKSLLQKNPGEDVLFVLDEYNFPLTRSVVIPAKHILFSASPDPRQGRAKHEEVNMWTRAYDHASKRICRFFGIQSCQPLPAGGPVYAGRNSVPREELAGGRKKDWLWLAEKGKFYFLLEGEKIESHDFLYWTADKILPRLHAQGIRRVSFEPVHESDFTEFAFACHAETGWHGDLVCASVCGSHRYVPAQFYDGWRGWNYLAARARKLGLSLGHWVGLHLSPRAPVLRKHPDYILKHVNTLGHSGGYSHLSICSINWRSGAGEWFLNDLKRWHDEGGLEWLFFDSWPNLGCAPINYGGRMEPMQWELGNILAKLQKIGYHWFSFEGTSPFGVHQYGLWDPMKSYKKHTAQGVMGQNDFAHWIGHEYMGYNQGLCPQINPRRGKRTLPEMSFRYAANRSTTLISHAKGLDQTYLALQPWMQKRYLLPNDRGVFWKSNRRRDALFAFKAFGFSLSEGTRVWEVKGGRRAAIPCNGVLETKPWMAYELEKSRQHHEPYSQ